MGSFRAAAATFVAIAVASASSAAQAQDVAAAEALFRRGLDDMLAGRYATGCPALAESHVLDPRPGTLFTLAECEAKAGRTATAVARYQDYLELFATLSADKRQKQRGREKDAARAKAALAPRVPELVLVLAPDAPDDTVVRRDGAVVGRASLGVSLPVDPGDHVVTVDRPGAPTVEARFTLAPGERKRLAIAPAPPAPVAAAPVADAPAAPAPAQAQPAPASRGDAQRTAGFVIGGLGLAGLVVGGVTGGLALGKKSVVDAECEPISKVCSRDGKAAVDAGRSLGLASTIGFAAGAGAVALGAVLVFTAPSTRKPTTSAAWSIDVAAGPRDLGLGVRGAF